MVGGQIRVRRRDGTAAKIGGESVKNGFVIFLAAFVVLAGSWGAFVLGPQLQLGGAKQVAVLNSTDVYPINRPGEANQGLQVYRANGCAACHTEQVQQTGVACDVVLTSFGNNQGAVYGAATGFMATSNIRLICPADKPQTFLFGVTEQKAEAVSDKITALGGKVETRIIATGPDITRGWGLRHSVAEDFLYDDPVQLGSLRAGPDLANVGARLTDANWLLLHLYSPQSVVKDSLMPPFRFLFEIQKIGREPSPDALNLPANLRAPVGYEVVPKPEAKQLVAYLLSLHTDVPLYDAPFTPSTAAMP
jgi:cbb3-type cytochrome oxidase cytochrome c subunit